MSEYRLPAALVEKMAEAAQAEYESRLNAVELQERDETVGRRVAEAAAAALLDECEVEARYAYVADMLPQANLGEFKLDPEKFHRLTRRLILTTPPEPVDPLPVAPFVRLEGPPGEELG